MVDFKQVWYRHIGVQYEIVKALRGHELQVIGDGISARWLNARHVSIFNKIMDGLNLRDRNVSFYRSLDEYRRIPLMSFNLKKRAKEYEAWGEIRQSEMLGSDFGLDLDCKQGSYKDAFGDAERIASLFNSFDVRYAFWMSGQHGFHFVVPKEDFPSEFRLLPYEQQIGFYKHLATILAKKCPSIDLSIYMPTRVLKCPYTIEKHGVVIYPLTMQDFEDLKSGMLRLEPEYLLATRPNLGFRGMYLQGKEEGMTNFIKNWKAW